MCRVGSHVCPANAATQTLQTKVNEALAKATRNRDELEKLAAMYGTKVGDHVALRVALPLSRVAATQDKEAASKAQQEAVLMETEIASLQKDQERIAVALDGEADGGIVACLRTDAACCRWGFATAVKVAPGPHNHVAVSEGCHAIWPVSFAKRLSSAAAVARRSSAPKCCTTLWPSDRRRCVACDGAQCVATLIVWLGSCR